MSDLEEQLRRYGEAVERAAGGEDADVIAHSGDGVGSRRSRSWVGAGVLAAAAALAGFMALPDRQNVTQVVAVDRESTSTTSDDEAASSDPFDTEAFAAAKLSGALDQTEDMVAVVAIIPPDENAGFEAAIGSLTELAGYSMVPADDLASAASAFAAARGSAELEDGWIAYGLIPQFQDSPVSDWVDRLRARFPRAVLVGTGFAVPTQPPAPDGWTVLADLPIGALDHPTVAAIGDLVVILGPESTFVVHPNGKVETAPAAPMLSPDACCPSVYPIGALQAALIVPDDQSGEAWLFEAERLAWTRLDDRPNPHLSLLGAAMIDGRLIVVNRAPQDAPGSSPVDELDLETGSWEPLDPLPVPISNGAVATGDDRLVVSGTLQGPNNNIVGDPNPSVLRFDGDAGWSVDQPAPISGQAATVVPLPDGQLLALNYGLEAALADRDGNWTAVDDVPMSESECFPQATPVDDGVIALCGGVAWWDSATAGWTPIPTPGGPGGQLVATSNGLVALVGGARERSSLLFLPLPPR
ncbi:MAG: hypothetical protein O3C27_08920 [Actinomycetota bacterium]|nr:hypothetical protein [Actinomycetota bacterium]